VITIAVSIVAAPSLAQDGGASGRGYDVDAATRAYLATLDGAARARSDAYFEGGYWLLLWGFLVGVGVALAFLHFGWSSRLSAWTGRKSGGRPFLRATMWAAIYTVGAAALALPWTIYTDFIREHRYGLSTQSFGDWFGDWLIALVLGAVTMSLLIAGLLALVRRTGDRWWSIGGAATVAVAAFMLLIAPVAIQPLFNTYRPLQPGPLREAILAMARANGVPAGDVQVVDQSRQTTRISANVSGLGGTTRVALNDNLLAQASPAEVRAVMGHELGHYVLNHSWSLLGGFGLLILGAFLAVARIVPAMLRRWGPRWGIVDIVDPAAVPAAIVVLSAYFLLATPLTNTLIRIHEQEADVFGLNAARAPDGFAAIAMKLSAYRKLEPGPWEEMLFFDHPSGRTRIETAMRWKAEHLHETGVE
jgi:STE24 endopeptidase